MQKPIKGYEGCYTIDENGKIFSKYKNKVMKTYINENGYEIVRLYKNKKSRLMRVHRALLLSFVDQPADKPIVNHKDGNKRNNTLSNLEWCTSSENNQHAIDTGLHGTDFNKKMYHVVIGDLDIISKGAKKAAKIIHDAGYLKNVSVDGIRAGISRSALTKSLFCGVLKAELLDDPYDIVPEYNKCGIKGRTVCIKVGKHLILKAKGPSKLADLIKRCHLAKLHGIDREKLIKNISYSANTGYKYKGYSIWFEE